MEQRENSAQYFSVLLLLTEMKYLRNVKRLPYNHTLNIRFAECGEKNSNRYSPPYSQNHLTFRKGTLVILYLLVPVIK